MKYIEHQRARYRDFQVLFGLLAGWAGVKLIQAGINGSSQEIWSLGIVFFTLVALVALPTLVRMRVQIGKKKIRYQLKPFSSKESKIKWKEVDWYEIVKTPYWAQLSGWGVRLDCSEAFHSIVGHSGLRLHLKDGRTIFLGLTHPDEADEYISQQEIEAEAVGE